MGSERQSATVEPALSPPAALEAAGSSRTQPTQNESLPVPKANQLDTNWLDQLEEAALIIDMDRMLLLIEQIRESHPALTEQLAGWINDFEYEQILAFIAQEKERR